MKKIFILTLSALLGAQSLDAGALSELLGKKQYVKEVKKDEKPTLEFWNKSAKTVYYTITPHPGTEQKIRVLYPGERFSGTHDNTFKQYALYLFATTKQEPEDDRINLYALRRLKPTTTLYIRLATDGITLGPQTGPWKGVTRRTKSGLPLKQNIKDEHIEDRSLLKVEDESTLTVSQSWFTQQLDKAINKHPVQ